MIHGREVPEWVGKTPDSRPPVAVKLRIFERAKGRCHITGAKIQAGDEWDVEHVKPLHLAAEGENLNRESNMAPALREPHRRKTAQENSAKAKADRVRAKHLGIYPKSKRPLKGRGFAPSRGNLP
jgi:5-methylcytosine-specific restriction protein A